MKAKIVKFLLVYLAFAAAGGLVVAGCALIPAFMEWVAVCFQGCAIIGATGRMIWLFLYDE